MKLKPMRPLETHGGPVKHIKPPKRKERAEIQTIATILLRRNKDLYEGGTGSDEARCLNLLSISETRTLTEQESQKAIAYIASLKEKA